MPKIIDGYEKFDRIKRNAYFARIALDTSFKPGEYAKKLMCKHLHDCIKYPTPGMITTYNELAGKEVNAPKYFFRNRHLALKSKSVKKLFNEYLQKLDSLYPKTLNSREFLIKTKRVILNGCNPVKHNLRRAIFKFFGM